MKFKNINIKTLIITLIIGFSYPVVRALAEPGNKLLFFLDSTTIIGLVYILIGLFYALILKGDFDASAYHLKNLRNKQTIPYEIYLKNKEKERENSFNYPLFLGILFFLISLVLAEIFY